MSNTSAAQQMLLIASAAIGCWAGFWVAQSIINWVYRRKW